MSDSINKTSDHENLTKPFRGSASGHAFGSGPSGCSARGIIFTVSSELSDEEICKEIGAAIVRHLTK